MVNIILYKLNFLQKRYTEDLLEKLKIEELDLSVRMYNNMKRAGINTVGDFCRYDFTQYKHINSINQKDFDSLLIGLFKAEIKAKSSNNTSNQKSTVSCEPSHTVVVENASLYKREQSEEEPIRSYFYWSYENFKLVEDEFGQKIIECRSFLPSEKMKMCHGMFILENHKSYYVYQGMMGFHIYETDRPIREGKTLFLEKDDGSLILLDKDSAEQIKLSRVMGLPLNYYSDIIPSLVHQDEEREPGRDHYIVVGQDPEDKTNMVCVQEYHDGYRTVWMSAKTFDTPIIIDEGRYSLSMPEEINDLLDSVEESAEPIAEAVENNLDDIPDGVYDVNINFAYKGKYYQINVDALDEYTPQMLFYIQSGLGQLLIEMGAVFVMGNVDIK